MHVTSLHKQTKLLKNDSLVSNMERKQLFNISMHVPFFYINKMEGSNYFLPIADY